MPMIHIEYDDKKVSKNEASTLADATQKIVSEITEINDVFVYGNSALIKVQVAPVEVFIEMSASKIVDRKDLSDKFKSAISKWKSESGFKHPINLTLIPMDWIVEIDI